MSNDRKGTEVYVGLFLLLGFAVIAWMFLQFGQLGRGLTRYKEITVEFPNASGLANSADVLLSGAPIGNVIGKPTLVRDKEGFNVNVTMKIQDDVQIPRESSFYIKQAGLLGDCYVEVVPPARYDPTNVIQRGEHVMGKSKPGLDVLQQEGSVVLDELKTELVEFKALTVNVNQNLMSAQNLKNLKETFAHLNTMSANLSASSEKLDRILDKGDSAVDSAKKTLETADKAAGDLRAAMAEFKNVAGSADKAIGSAKTMLDTGNRVLKKAEQGDGALGVLLSDKETASNLKSFVGNLKRSGPVFYKDRPTSATPAPLPPRRR